MKELKLSEEEGSLREDHKGHLSQMILLLPQESGRYATNIIYQELSTDYTGIGNRVIKSDISPHGAYKLIKKIDDKR